MILDGGLQDAPITVCGQVDASSSFLLHNFADLI